VSRDLVWRWMIFFSWEEVRKKRMMLWFVVFVDVVVWLHLRRNHLESRHHQSPLLECLLLLFR